MQNHAIINFTIFVVDKVKQVWRTAKKYKARPERSQSSWDAVRARFVCEDFRSYNLQTTQNCFEVGVYRKSVSNPPIQIYHVLAVLS